MNKMKALFVILVLFVFIEGCTRVQDLPTISETSELILNVQDLKQLGMTGDCKTEGYETDEYSSLAQYSFCSYNITSLNDTEVIIELKKFTNLNDLNGTYQYESLHYRSAEGLISKNDYGDQSRFYVNNENDYGGQYNDPNVYYYTLYITKDEYLIHITSKGSKEARGYIAKT